MSQAVAENQNGVSQGEVGGSPPLQAWDTFTGVIRDMQLLSSKEGFPQLRFLVELHSKLRDGFRPEAGADPLARGVPNQVQVLMTIADTQVSMERNAQDLARLGYEGDELPSDPTPFRGKKVMVKISPNREGVPTYWNFYFLGGWVKQEDLEKAAAAEKNFRRNHSLAWKEALERARAGKKSAPRAAAAPAPPVDAF